jgi:hypothetical protein
MFNANPQIYYSKKFIPKEKKSPQKKSNPNFKKLSNLISLEINK